MKIEYWSDYACPYCYIGETCLEHAIEELGLGEQVELSMKAFELDPNTPKDVVSDTPTRFAQKYRLSLEGAKERIEGISKLGRKLGIDFRYATTQYSNTFDAHRLTKFAHSKGNTAIEKLLFDAYFTRNEVLADHDVLVALAAEAGFDADEAREVLESDAFTDEVRADEALAYQLGVTGVPFFLIDGKLAIPGTLDDEGFRQVLKRALNEELETMAQGKACGIDGCEA